jgi:hypothetical protein
MDASTDTLILGQSEGLEFISGGSIVSTDRHHGTVGDIDAEGTIVATANFTGGVKILSRASEGTLETIGTWPTDGVAYLQADRVHLSGDGSTLYVVGLLSLSGGSAVRGVTVLSLADPTSPAYVDFEPTTSGITTPRSIALGSEYLYYGDGENLRVFSIGGDGSLTEESSTAFSKVWDLALGTGMLYVYDQSEGLIACLLSTATDPVPVDTLMLEGLGDTDPLYMDVDLSRSLLAVAGHGHLRKLHLVDISKLDLVELGAVSIPTPTSVSISGEVVAVAAYNEGVRLYDISDPSAPVEVQQYGSSYVKGVMLEGDRLLLGDYFYVSSFEVTVTTVSGVVSHGRGPMPSRFEITSVAPNPFNAMSRTRVALPEAGHLTVYIVNLLGQRVATLKDGTYPAGEIDLVVNANHLASGQYFIVATHNGQAQVRSMVLIR